jgi:TolB-like protein/Tfp pilus assembly protein PilF
MLILFAVGMGLHTAIFRRLARTSASAGDAESRSLIVGFGLMFIVQNAATLTWGGGLSGMPYLDRPISIGSTVIVANRLLIIACMAAVSVLLVLTLRKTLIGKAVRGMLEAPLGALLVGWLGTAWFAQYPPFDALPVASQVAARGPSILVAPFENDDSDAIDSALVRGFTREVIIGLTRFDDLFVFGPATSLRYEGSGDLPGSAARLPVDFVLTGGVMVSDNRLRAAVTLRNAKTGRYVWSDTIERELTVGGIFQARETIANQVVQALAQPYGIIFREKSKEIEGTLPQFFTSYQCMLEFYNYWRSLSLPLHATVQSCLEKAVTQDPDYSEAYSALAMVYANIPRYGFNSHGVAFDPLPKALELARHSIELAPDSVQGYKALHLVYWLMNDVDRSFAAAEQGLALNPNDSEIMADLGGRLCLAGNWERGMPLVQEAFARNPDQPGLYRIVTSLRFYLDGRYKDALAEIEKANIPSVIHYHVILAMAHAQLGQMKQADAEVKEVLKIDPAYGENVIADLRKHNVYPDLIHAVVEGLRKAGLKVSDSVADRAS